VSVPRIFTLDEAERTLPLLRRILADLTAEHETWRAGMARYEVLAAVSRADEGETEPLKGARLAATASADRINSYLKEIESVGCIFKGFESGLVDFYSLREDRLVFLCWRLSEEHITHWHEVDAGFTGRQPIDPATFSAVIP
jgi:hypothetical protein